MRLTLTLAVAVSLALGAAGRVADAQERIDQRRPLSRQGALRIQSLYGSITIVGWDRDTVVVTGTVSTGERFFFGGTGQGLKMGVETQEERTVRGAHLTIHVPAGARVWVKTASAELRVSGVTGGLDLYSVGANIRVEGSPRELTAESMDGSISIDGSPDWLRAKTATGDITYQGGSEDAAFSTVSGTIRVAGGPIRRGKAESITGPISIGASLARDGAVDIDTHSGRVEIALPRGGDALFDVVALAGVIRNEITTARAVADLPLRGTELHFSTRPDDSLPRVGIRTFKGEVVLRRR